MHDLIFEQVNQQLGCAIHWMPLGHEGTSNWLYQGSDGHQVLVLRVNARNPVAFGVCREREAFILQQLHGHAWAAQVVCNRPDLGWCVMQHHGLSPGQSALSAVFRRDLLQAVAALQTLPLPEGAAYRQASLDYPGLFQQYQAALNRASDPEPWLRLLNRLVEMFAALPALPETYVHHDLHPGNLCWQDGQLVLIDWEYAGVGSPWFDAAGLVHGCGISSDEVRKLPAFCQLSPVLFQLGLQQASEATRLLEKLWYKARAGS